jgi:hypothetical protein
VPSSRRRCAAACTRGGALGRVSTGQASANQTFRSASDAQAKAAFTARLIALDHALDLLTETSWAAAPKGKLIERALAVNRTDQSRFAISGADLHVEARPPLSPFQASDRATLGRGKLEPRCSVGLTVAVCIRIVTRS